MFASTSSPLIITVSPVSLISCSAQQIDVDFIPQGFITSLLAKQFIHQPSYTMYSPELVHFFVDLHFFSRNADLL